MTRSGTETGRHEGRLVGRERAFRGVEMVDQNAVEAEIGDEQKLVVGRNVDRVGVRARLAFVIHAGTGVLDEGGGFAQ